MKEDANAEDRSKDSEPGSLVPDGQERFNAKRLNPQVSASTISGRDQKSLAKESVCSNWIICLSRQSQPDQAKQIAD
jgi:hypothetical protein